ncbi:MAG: hypothetical protein NTW86_32890, partial [Candidatus Sumerlaeota bacterium]|nr:hypothetical protein [Candidatus Sumerlaeota bacterium]
MRLSSYLAVLAFLLFAAAAPAKPTFSCLPGFGGFFRPGDWTPINVVIENVPDSPADRPYTLEGELRVKTRPLQGDETVFVRRVAVTHQQKIKVVLYARISQDAACGAEFRTRNGRRLWEQDLKPDLTALRPEQRLIVVASDLSAPFSPRSATDLRGQRRAHVLPGLLPDLWVGYESVDLLVAPKDLSNDLPDPEQREALLSWVRFGGRLLAVGGVHYQSYQGSFLEPILPVKIAGSEEVALPAAGGESLRLLDATFDLKPQAAGLWRLGERPLAARWPVGRGEATFVGVDMDSAVARESAEARALWDSCVYAPGLGRRHSLADSMVFGGVDFAYGRAAELPSILLILVLLGCYTILVGPVNFYVLSKRRRLELAWITIPAIVAAFSVLTYAIGFTSKGGLLIMREMDVIQAGVDSADARLEKLVSLFSPRKRSYNLAFDSPRSAFCGVWEWADREHGIGARFVGAGGAVGGAGWPMAIDQSRRPIAIFDRLVAQWSSQSFGGLSAFDLGGRFEGEAVLREVDRKREMTVRLKNGAAFPLRDSTLLLGASAGAVGDLDPGESREFQIPLDDRKSAQGFAKDGMGSLATAFDPQMYGYRNAGGLNNPDDAENPQVVRDYLRAKVWQRFNEPPEGFAPPVTAPLRPRLVG